jgi:hypothetical protein
MRSTLISEKLRELLKQIRMTPFASRRVIERRVEAIDARGRQMDVALVRVPPHSHGDIDTFPGLLISGMRPPAGKPTSMGARLREVNASQRGR